MAINKDKINIPKNSKLRLLGDLRLKYKGRTFDEKKYRKLIVKFMNYV